MRWLTERLTPKRLGLVALIVGVTVVLVVIGDPLAHGEVGSSASGQRSVGGVPRVAELAGILIALILAWPPGGRDRRPKG